MRRKNLAKLFKDCFFENRRRCGTRRIESALTKAIDKDLIKAGATFHSDRGSQYASNGFRELMGIEGLRQFELLGGEAFEYISQARTEIFSYIEDYYNRVRLHTSLSYQSPMEYELNLKIRNGGNDREFCVH